MSVSLAKATQKVLLCPQMTENSPVSPLTGTPVPLGQDSAPKVSSPRAPKAHFPVVMSQVVDSAEAFREAHTQVTSQDLGPLPQGQWGNLRSGGKAGSKGGVGQHPDWWAWQSSDSPSGFLAQVRQERPLKGSWLDQV